MCSMVRTWLYDLKGREVVFTGRFSGGHSEAELAALARRLGASRVSEDCNLTTNVLVRGQSGHWKHGAYGRKEEKVAAMQSSGKDVVIIDLGGLLALRDGLPAPVLQPHVPEAAARLSAAEGGLAGAPYRRRLSPEPVDGSGDYFRDPDRMDRALAAHSKTQEALAQAVRAAALEPLSPMEQSCNYDLAWMGLDGQLVVAEVKSLTQANELFQVRHALGQVLDYAYSLSGRGFRVRPLVVLETAPQRREHWMGLCHSRRVDLTWGPDFADAVVRAASPWAVTSAPNGLAKRGSDDGPQPR
jgi:hypothetical protein